MEPLNYGSCSFADDTRHIHVSGCHVRPTMTFAPKRRWFRFSLRTLFVVVTVTAVWVGLALAMNRVSNGGVFSATFAALDAT
jgi:hypothetical protein